MNARRPSAGQRGWPSLLIGSLAMAGCQWSSLWVLARTAPAEIVGRYALGVAWLVPLFAVTGLQLRALMATEYALKDQLRQYGALRISGGLLAAVIVLTIALSPIGDRGLGPVLLAASFPRFAELLSDFCDGLRHHERQYNRIGWSQVCRALVAFLGFSVTWVCTNDLVFSFLAAGAAAGASALLLDWIPGTRLRLNWTIPGGTLPILRFAAPLALVGFLNTGLVSLPRLLLGQLASLEAVATFSCLLAVLSLPNLLASAYCVARAPDLAAAFAARDHAQVSTLIASASIRIAGAATVATIALVWVGPWLVQFVFGGHYQVSRAAILCLSLFTGLWSIATVFGTAATAARWIGIQVALFSMALFSVAAVGVLTIPAFEVTGAAFSLMSGAVVLLAAYVVVFARRLIRMRPSDAASLISETGFGEPGPARILHVTSALHVGGVELWLSRLLDSSPTDQQAAVLSIGEQSGELASSFIRRGVPVHCVPAGGSIPRFLWNLARFLRKTGPWDIVHSHVGRRSALVLLVARIIGVPVRISQCHHAESGGRGCARGPLTQRLVERAYAAFSEFVLRFTATTRLACSAQAGEYLYGRSASAEQDFEVIHCGVDLDACREEVNSWLPELGWQRPPDAIVVAHVGRFAPEKNHTFLVDVAYELKALDQRFHFLLLGDGPLRERTERKVEALGLGSHVHFLGVRPDVLAVLAHHANVFFFPSRSEGLGVAMVEAQIAGLPCFYAAHLPCEVDLFPDANARFCLEDSPETVAHQLREFVLQSNRSDSSERLGTLAQSRFSMSHNRRQLTALYRRCLGRTGGPWCISGETDPTCEATVWN